MGGDGSIQLVSTASPTYVDVAALAAGNGPLTWASLNYGNASGFAAAYMLVKGQPVTLELLAGSTLSMSRKVDARQAGGSGANRHQQDGKEKQKGHLTDDGFGTFLASRNGCGCRLIFHLADLVHPEGFEPTTF